MAPASSVELVAGSTYCTDCETALDGLAGNVPCPQCGGMGRGVALAIEDAIHAVTSFPGVTVVITYGQRTWENQPWKSANEGLEELRRIYDGTSSLDGGEAVDVAANVLRDCDRLLNWLEYEELPDSVKCSARLHFRKDPNLQLAGEFRHTWEYGRRRNPQHRSVYVDSVTGTRPSDRESPQVRITLAVDRDGQRIDHVDALKLASSCVGAWHDFLRRKEMLEATTVRGNTSGTRGGTEGETPGNGEEPE